MSKTTIIFDLDGTIINSSKSIISSFNYAFKKFKIKKINIHYFKKNASKGSKFFIKNNLNKSNYFLLKKIDQNFHSIYSKNCTKYISCKKGLRWFLKNYKSKFNFIICTNKKEIYSHKILKKLNIYNYFDKIYGSDSTNFKKPSKKLFDLITINSKIQKKNVIIVGDSNIDYDFANISKADFILVKNGYTNMPQKHISQKYAINNFYEIKKVLILMKKI